MEEALIKRVLPHSIEAEQSVVGAMLMDKETVEAYHMKGKSHDCGNKLGYMQAFVEYGIRHNTLGDEFKSWLEGAVGIKK